ncbi:winged helix-turn-helix transcriptional regulator [Radicibacter daui]|uniref:winged helix-turn-helix transcriptional regulator n=1 Tax=Radicibacter daui TaxID=3064829 RepID=UPI004046FAEE
MALHKQAPEDVAGCPVRDVINRFGNRWSLLVVICLKDGTKRFTAIKRDIEDISQRMLAQTLRQLEQDGLVSRTVVPSTPPRVDYALTDLGRSLMTPLDALVKWASDNHDAILDARASWQAPPCASACNEADDEPAGTPRQPESVG